MAGRHPEWPCVSKSTMQEITNLFIALRASGVTIPWPGNKGCLSSGSTDRSTITRLRAKSEDDIVFMSLSYRLHVVFICFVPNPGKRAINLGVLMAMHWRQGSTTPDHGMICEHFRDLARILIYQCRRGCECAFPVFQTR